MIITLDVYSGRPNPSWRISDKDSARLLERIVGRAVTAAAEAEGGAALGPRGFIVSAGRDDELPEGTPESFRLGGLGQAQAAGAAFSASESDELNYPAHGDVERLAESSLYPFVKYVWDVVTEMAAHK